MDSKMKYDIDHAIPNFSLTQIEQGIMKIWQKAEDGSVLYHQCEELTELVHEKQNELGLIREMLNLFVGKL